MMTKIHAAIWAQWVNSLAPGRSGCNSLTPILIFLRIDTFRSYDNAFRWVPWVLTDDELTLVQVMACCHQATSHYLSQCWLRSLSPNGITRPQWVKKNHHRVWHWLCCTLYWFQEAFIPNNNRVSLDTCYQISIVTINHSAAGFHQEKNLWIDISYLWTN